MEHDINKVHESFCRKVRTMLLKQQEYFKTRDKNTLGECKKLEREVMNYCDTIIGNTLF